MADMLALKAERYAEAVKLFGRADASVDARGDYFRKYGGAATIRSFITEHLTALIEPGMRGITHAEAEQAREH